MDRIWVEMYRIRVVMDRIQNSELQNAESIQPYVTLEFLLKTYSNAKYADFQTSECRKQKNITL